MKQIFNKSPVCEACQSEPATSFSYFRNEDSWKFTGECTRETEDYYIQFERFFESPKETVDWVAHMSEKGWMNWADFAGMMHRLRNSL